MTATPTPGALEALVQGRHGDPFALLGMHAQHGPRGGVAGLVVRALLPWAQAVRLIEAGSGKELGALARLHPDGLFEIKVKRRKPFAYRLRVETPHHGTVEWEDPYRFPPVLGELDVHLLGEGNHLRSYEKLGAHPMLLDGVPGTGFAVWAPNASRVSVVGDFNGWDGRLHPMRLRHGTGVWEIFLPGVAAGARYKYELLDAQGRLLPLKADPCGTHAERRPDTASIVHGLPAHDWQDGDWMAARAADRERGANGLGAPISIYEVHAGSWRRGPEGRFLSYDELADSLIPYVRDMGFTHIELLPVSEHPFDGSWGYQPVGLFAPTSRFGPPEAFARFVDRCHQAGIGVILDWVPGHFPTDAHGLAQFDGTALYEHADPRQGFQPDWNTLIYNLGRREVANFLLSNALYWLDRFHIDGLRVDAVASMLYLDYSRKDGEWVPNPQGGRENLEAIEFLKRLNIEVFGREDGTTTLAEESTAWPGVSRPVYAGGLGFGFKWNMGWMHDTLRYMAKDPIHRRHHHHDLTFGLLYAFTENFVLPLSHDEVVHGKGSLIGRMPGDEWQRFATLRAYLGFMWTHPGKKLLFMGGEFGQWGEWSHDRSLDWSLLDHGPYHRGVQTLVRDLNRLYRHLPALHALDCNEEGFAWIEASDNEHSVLAFVRFGQDRTRPVLVVCNFTPEVRHGYRLGVPEPGTYVERLNSDAACYGGSDIGNGGHAETQPTAWHGRPYSLTLTLPPLGMLVLEREG